ncbi:MAG: RNA methyltransferase [Flavobacteriales bacterium]|nr:RNA methyltransferase [Flavobacteriales bacterium]
MLTKNQIKLIRSLSLKKNRLKHGLFIVEGEKLVNEVLSSDWTVEAIYATKEWLGENAIIISNNDLSRISSLKTPNKVIAVVQIKKDSLDITGNTVLALDGVKDPGNLGTIIRLADWFGVKDIICSDDCVDYLNPKVVQSSMGSFTRVNLHYTSLIDAFKKYSDYKLFMTVLNGSPLSELTKDDKKIIVMGSESKGISKEILELTSEKITIPKSKSSKAESLNVSVAAAIILSAI